MDQLKDVSWLRLVATIGLLTGSSGCAATGADGAERQNAGTGGGGDVTAATGGAPALGGSGGSPSSGVAGMGSQSNGSGGSGGGAAPGGPDAAVVGRVPDGGAGAAGQDAGSDAGADASVIPPQGAGCAGSTFALCEDFESGALDTKVWKTMQSDGTATLDASRGARGSKYSVHVHVDSGSDTMVGITESKTFPALKEGLSARAFIFIPSAMTSSLFMGDRHSRLIYAQGEGEYALGIWNGGLIQNHYSQSDDSVDTKMLPPFDEWFCLEYELDSANGNVKAYLNDVEITALQHEGWPAMDIETLMFGVDRYGDFPVDEDIWFDDLVVDSAHIGCTR
jgi:hypothetical protein